MDRKPIEIVEINKQRTEVSNNSYPKPEIEQFAAIIAARIGGELSHLVEGVVESQVKSQLDHYLKLDEDEKLMRELRYAVSYSSDGIANWGGKLFPIYAKDWGFDVSVDILIEDGFYTDFEILEAYKKREGIETIKHLEYYCQRILVSSKNIPREAILTIQGLHKACIDYFHLVLGRINLFRILERYWEGFLEEAIAAFEAHVKPQGFGMVSISSATSLRLCSHIVCWLEDVNKASKDTKPVSEKEIRILIALHDIVDRFSCPEAAIACHNFFVEVDGILISRQLYEFLRVKSSKEEVLRNRVSELEKEVEKLKSDIWDLKNQPPAKVLSKAELCRKLLKDYPQYHGTMSEWARFAKQINYAEGVLAYYNFQTTFRKENMPRPKGEDFKHYDKHYKIYWDFDVPFSQTTRLFRG